MFLLRIKKGYISLIKLLTQFGIHFWRKRTKLCSSVFINKKIKRKQPEVRKMNLYLVISRPNNKENIQLEFQITFLFILMLRCKTFFFVQYFFNRLSINVPAFETAAFFTVFELIIIIVIIIFNYYLLILVLY